jgi:zinc transport system permease protein
MLEALQFEFMRQALFAGLLTSIICGIIGTLVVVNRIVFLSGGIAHAAYGGIGLAVFCGWPFLPATIAFALFAAVIMAAVTLKVRHRADTVIGVLWAFGMAVGIILLDLTPGYNVDFMSYLFGSILAVPSGDLWVMSAVAAVIIIVLVVRYEDFLAMSYDAEFARLRGVPVTALYYILIATVAVAVVLIIRVVGLILVIALLTIPPYIAEKYTRALWQMMALAVALSILFTLIGLWLSYAFNLTTGACIILVAACGFLLSQVIGLIKNRQVRLKNDDPVEPKPDSIKEPI